MLHHTLRSAVLACGVFASLNTFAQMPTGFAVQHWTTAEGVAVHYVLREELPMLDLQVVFDAGSARDGKDYGLANITAMMLEQGAAGIDSDTLAKQFDQTGAQYGVSVAKDMSVVSLRVLTDPSYLDPALDWFITVLSQPDFPKEALQRLVNQRLTAIKKRTQLPAELATIAFNRAVFGDHPYAHPVSGEEQTVRNLTVDKLRNFYAQYFVTGNALITLVGNVSRKQAEELAAKISSSLLKGAPAPQLPPVAPVKSQQVHIPFDSQQAHVYIGQPGLRFGDEDFFSLYLANRIFGGSGFGSRLVQEVRVKNGYAYSVWSYFMPQRMQGAFTISFQTQKEQAKPATELVIRMLKDLRAEGVTEAELTLAKKSVRDGFPLRIGDNRSIAIWVTRIAFYRLGDAFLSEFVPAVARVDRAVIKEALARRVDPDNLIIVTVGG